MSAPLKAILLESCEMGQTRSRKDHSVVFSVETPELRPSESGTLIQLHGTASSLLITPHDTPDAELVEVKTERGIGKSPGTRLRAVLYIWWQQLGSDGIFNHFYDEQMEKLIGFVKSKLTP
jgi:hypothetical protein